MGQVCTVIIIPITAYMGDNYLSQTASTILWSVTVSIYCVGGMWAESLQDTGPTNGAGMYIY